jgi:sugar fermentation stimulation protein A
MILPKSARGSYILVIHVTEALDSGVGSLGELSFRPGWYLYVGSAMAGLSVRLRRHFNRSKAPHWHVDYLTNRALIDEVAVFPSRERIECRIADVLKVELPSVAGFGCSDCDCPSHLLFCESQAEADVQLARTISLLKVDCQIMGRKAIRAYLHRP